jgi:hypothetical protein
VQPFLKDEMMTTRKLSIDPRELLLPNDVSGAQPFATRGAHTFKNVRGNPAQLRWWMAETAYAAYWKSHAESRRTESSGDKLLAAAFQVDLSAIKFFKSKAKGAEVYVVSHPEADVLSFRGSEILGLEENGPLQFDSVIKDWVRTDANAVKQPWARLSSTPKAHTGFAKAMDALLDQTNGISTFFADIIKTGRPLYICGHSLGGAMAMLAAAYCAENGIAKERIKVFTFGAPLVGGRGFANLFTGIAVERFVFQFDIVPRVPVASVSWPVPPFIVFDGFSTDEGIAYRHVPANYFLIDGDATSMSEHTSVNGINYFKQYLVYLSASGGQVFLGIPLPIDLISRLPNLVLNHSPLYYAVGTWNIAGL